MDRSVRRPDVLQRNLRVLNQKQERDVQQRLNMLDKQYRLTRKMLKQRQDLLKNEQKKVVMVKVCEPKATVGIAMEEIREHNEAEMHVRAIQTSDGRRLSSQGQAQGSDITEQSRSISAPPVKPSASVRRRGRIHSSISFMQMKSIATIDSISEKELARQRQRAQEEMERLRRSQSETLHNRVAAFLEMLRDKGDMQMHVEPP